MCTQTEVTQPNINEIKQEEGNADLITIQTKEINPKKKNMAFLKDKQ